MPHLVPLLIALLTLLPPGAHAERDYEKEHGRFKAGQQNNAWRETRCRDRSQWLPGVRSQRWVDGRYRHPSGARWDRGQVCELTLDDGQVLFHDGCSGEPIAYRKADPIAGEEGKRPWGEVFHTACVLHDHCYHHNPSTYGKRQNDCDNEMFTDMQAICAERYADDAKGRKRCLKAANKIYRGIASLGGKHFDAFDIRSDYLLIYPGKSAEATEENCPALLKRIGTRDGKPVCGGKGTRKITRSNCRDKPGIIEGEYCLIEKDDYFNARVLKE